MMKRFHSQRSVACFRRWSRAGYSAFASMHKQVRIGVLGVGMSIISLAATEAYAADVDSMKVFKVVDIDDVGVTLEKESPTRSAMAQTQLFSRATQAAAPLQTLESALRLSPSIDVRERGGKGIQTDLSIRGGSFDQTMVLLNGINFTDARTGHQTHSLPIDIESVAAIDLIDGIAGVGAYAGAINFRTAPLQPTYLRLDAAGGENGYGYTNLSGAYSTDRLTIYGTGSWKHSDGYIHNTDFNNLNGFLRATYDSKNAGFFDLQAGAQQREFGANGFYSLKFLDQREATETYLASLRWFKRFNHLTINATSSYRKNFDRFELIAGSPDKVPYNYHMTDNLGAELWADYTWSAGKSTIGADYTYNQIYSTVLGETMDEPQGEYTKFGDRAVTNIYVRHIKSWESVTTAGAIGMSQTPYGTSTLWSASASYRPLEELFLELGATGSMRLPTFTDLYYTATGYIANKNLVPEQATTYRLNGGYDISRWSLAAQVYLRQGTNVIDWVKASADKDWQSTQLTNLSTLGSEITASYSPQGIVERVSISYGHIDMDKDSGKMISKYATDYMRDKMSAEVLLRLPWNLSLTLCASGFSRQGNYTSAAGEIEEYEPYFLLDGRLSWEQKRVRIYLDMTNITSTEYFDYGGLMMPKAWGVIGASFTL